MGYGRVNLFVLLLSFVSATVSLSAQGRIGRLHPRSPRRIFLTAHLTWNHRGGARTLAALDRTDLGRRSNSGTR